MTFLYTCCQLGAEKALKEELALAHPELRFAYSRPGFVTFKAPGPLPPDFELRSVFARTWGFSVGKQEGLEQAAAAARALLAELKLTRAGLHVWERDLHPVGEEPPGFVAGSKLTEIRDEFTRLLQPAIHPEQPEWILDLIDLGGGELWLGYHHRKFGARSRCSQAAGGAISVNMPEDSPSRAFIKLEQALTWSGLEPRPGQTALEVGSAPGGASYALLLREVAVCGIDPGAMDPLFRQRYPSRFRHVKKSVSQVSAADLPESIDWLVLDINAKPKVTLSLIHDLIRHTETRFLRLQGMILTLKINDWKLARFIPEWLEQIGEMAGPFGLAQIRATQLPANRQEICVVARRRPIAPSLKSAGSA